MKLEMPQTPTIRAPQTRLLIARVYGGLANRLGTLISAQIAAARCDRHVVLHWELNKNLNCRFNDLFDASTGVEVAHIARRERGMERWGFGPAVRPRWRSRKRLHQDDVDDSAFTQIHTLPEDVVWIRTCHTFQPAGMTEADFQHEFTGRLNALTLAAPVQQRIDEFRAQHITNNTVGVHVRRTDHKKAIARSTNDQFIAQMQRLIDELPDARFFLCTDSPDVRELLAGRFGSRVFHYPTESLARNQPVGIRDALIEMRLLGHTRLILGSFGSTFSRLAAQFHGIELRVVQ